MSRYTGPVWKKSRRLGYSILETGKELSKRNYAPGQHGNDKKKKLTEYGRQLQEKQKVREMYGVNERQFQRLYKIAKGTKGVTGYNFLKLLESRADNLVYRMGLARTRRAARQLVNHGHITVNGQKMDIPSYICKPGDVIALGETSKNLVVCKAARELVVTLPAFVTWDDEKACGTFVREPERNEICHDIQENLIVEFYNKKI